MGRTKIDYAPAEREYVTGNDSYRNLAKKYHVGFGSMAEYGRNHEWDKKRVAYRSSVSSTALDHAREQHVSEYEEMLDDAVGLIRATFYEYGRQLRDGLVVIAPKDLVQLTNLLSVLNGGVSNRTEATVLGISTTTDLGSEGLDVLRELERVARAKLVNGAVGDPAPVRVEGPRPN